MEETIKFYRCNDFVNQLQKERKLLMLLNFSTCTITDVSLQFHTLRNSLLFELDGISYRLHFVQMQDGSLIVTGVKHGEDTCHFCKKTGEKEEFLGKCNTLYKNRKTLVERLLQEPAVRLRWFFKQQS